MKREPVVGLSAARRLEGRREPGPLAEDRASHAQRSGSARQLLGSPDVRGAGQAARAPQTLTVWQS